MNINNKGDIAVAKVCLRALEKGCVVSKPTSDAVRYDLIIDDNGKLLRAQVKYAGNAKQKGVARLSLEKNYYRKSGIKTVLYNSSEIDIILAYIPAIDKICIFTSDDFENKRGFYIRYEPTTNGQKIGISRLAENYEW
jgi:hypothetical protein